MRGRGKERKKERRLVVWAAFLYRVGWLGWVSDPFTNEHKHKHFSSVWQFWQGPRGLGHCSFGRLSSRIFLFPPCPAQPTRHQWRALCWRRPWNNTAECASVRSAHCQTGVRGGYLGFRVQNGFRRSRRSSTFAPPSSSPGLEQSSWSRRHTPKIDPQ